MARSAASARRRHRQWYGDVPPARQSFPCGRARHDVVWDAGRLRLDAHGSVDAERALRTLGGRPPACLLVVDEWMDALREPHFFEEWARLERPERQRLQRFGQLWTDRVVRDDDKLAPLAHLSDAMLDRLAFCVLQRWLRQGGGGDHMVDLVLRATAARVRRGLVQTLVAAGIRGGLAPLVPLQCALGPQPSATGLVSGRAQSQIDVVVPASWILDVYARGLTVVGHDLVLSAEPEEAGAYRVTALRWRPTDAGLQATTESFVTSGAPGRG